MNTDIRLATGFLQNQKVIKLRRRYGADAVLGLISLWLYAAENNPDGVLDGFDAESIDIACCEHSASICAALLELKFIEKTETGYIIHDWQENQPWAINAKKRSEQARNAAQKRWEKQALNAERMLSAKREHPVSNAPILSLPKDNNKQFKKPSLQQVKEYCIERGNSVDPHAFMDSNESKGWVVGKTPMKDWKAAVRTWEHNNFGKKNEPKKFVYDPAIHGYVP